ncbi:MAG: DUF4149 domain-containing protein [Actinomycetota bacterium]
MNTIAVLSITWFGLVIGVSFLATPVKFRAQSLSLPVALEVGHVTFHLFAKLEWALSVAVTAAAIVVGLGPEWVFVAAVLAIVIVQAAYLLPRLDRRVEAIIGGETLPRSHLHTVFAGLEGVKAVVLLLLGLSML